MPAVLKTLHEVSAATGLTPEGVRAAAASGDLHGYRLVTEAFIRRSTLYTLHEVAEATGLSLEGVRARAAASTVPGYRLHAEAYLPIEPSAGRPR